MPGALFSRLPKFPMRAVKMVPTQVEAKGERLFLARKQSP
jgi:hypothetical protein